jgi:hypothetical protein
VANVRKRWRGAVEPAETGASGNEYKRWRGAVEPQFIATTSGVGGKTGPSLAFGGFGKMGST